MTEHPLREFDPCVILHALGRIARQHGMEPDEDAVEEGELRLACDDVQWRLRIIQNDSMPTPGLAVTALLPPVLGESLLPLVAPVLNGLNAELMTGKVYVVQNHPEEEMYRLLFERITLLGFGDLLRLTQIVGLSLEEYAHCAVVLEEVLRREMPLSVMPLVGSGLDGHVPSC